MLIRTGVLSGGVLETAVRLPVIVPVSMSTRTFGSGGMFRLRVCYLACRFSYPCLLNPPSPTFTRVTLCSGTHLLLLVSSILTEMMFDRSWSFSKVLFARVFSKPKKLVSALVHTTSLLIGTCNRDPMSGLP